MIKSLQFLMSLSLYLPQTYIVRTWKFVIRSLINIYVFMSGFVCHYWQFSCLGIQYRPMEEYKNIHIEKIDFPLTFHNTCHLWFLIKWGIACTLLSSLNAGVLKKVWSSKKFENVQYSTMAISKKKNEQTMGELQNPRFVNNAASILT
jgi:hypothetical protein